jgi:hypothetical protein
MRKLIRKRALIVGGLALSLSIGMSGIAYAQNGTQTIFGSLTGTKNASLYTGVEYIPGSDGVVAHATNTLVKFPSEAKITAKGISQCNPATLEGTTTEQAVAACGKSQVQSCTPAPKSPCGSAIADVVGADLDAVVTAFNGTSVNGNPSILLHSRVDAASLTTVLVGEIRPPAARGATTGYELNVPVPPLAGGAAAIQRFEATVQKKIKSKKSGKAAHASKKKKKKKKAYVKASQCADGQHTWEGVFDFSDAPQATASFNEPC